ncbi:hypothetical protein TWF694_001064 [Orbilia ellipsospora]|uniref:Chitin-binding type-1 domain-containing protein n=1 Tax=Orbilia ellipsospora TaxID=2528407 RepID=A0AAV9XQS8_9PEZI
MKPLSIFLITFYFSAIVASLSYGGLTYREEGELSHNELFQRQSTPVSGGCGMFFAPSNTTTVTDVLDTFQITAQEFVALNPGNGLFMYHGECSGFRNFRVIYCVRGVELSPVVSSDGTCGSWNNGKACAGSSYGDCCNASGRCGSGYDYCGIGNCREGACEGGFGWSVDGKCGSRALEPKCGGKWGICCNSSNQCGNGTSYCGASACIDGACDWITTSATPTTTSSSTTTTSSITTTGLILPVYPSMFPATSTLQCISEGTPVPRAPLFYGGSALSTGISTACKNLVGIASTYLVPGDPYIAPVAVNGITVKFTLLIRLNGFLVTNGQCVQLMESINTGCPYPVGASPGATKGGAAFSSDYNLFAGIWEK